MIIRFLKLTAADAIEISALLQPRCEPVVRRKAGHYIVTAAIDSRGLGNIAELLEKRSCVVNFTVSTAWR